MGLLKEIEKWYHRKLQSDLNSLSIRIAYGRELFHFFFPWRYSRNLGLGLPPWNSLFQFGFLDFRQSVGLLGRVISSSQGIYLYINTEKRTHTHTKILNIHALSGIRTHDPGFRASESSSCFDRSATVTAELVHYYCIFLSIFNYATTSTRNLAVKLTVVYLFKESAAFIHPKISLPCPQHLFKSPQPERDESNSYVAPHLSKLYINIILAFMSGSSKWVFTLRFSYLNFNALSSFQYVLRVPSIRISFIWSI
jgi:hypothetical protein